MLRPLIIKYPNRYKIYPERFWLYFLTSRSIFEANIDLKAIKRGLNCHLWN